MKKNQKFNRRSYKMFETAMAYWSQHIILANASHAAGGFGLALILQRYLGGKPFLPVAVGWILLGFTVVTHAIAYAQ